MVIGQVRVRSFLSKLEGVRQYQSKRSKLGKFINKVKPFQLLNLTLHIIPVATLPRN